MGLLERLKEIQKNYQLFKFLQKRWVIRKDFYPRIQFSLREAQKLFTNYVSTFSRDRRETKFYARGQPSREINLGPSFTYSDLCRNFSFMATPTMSSAHVIWVQYCFMPGKYVNVNVIQLMQWGFASDPNSLRRNVENSAQFNWCLRQRTEWWMIRFSKANF